MHMMLALWYMNGRGVHVQIPVSTTLALLYHLVILFQREL